MKGSSFDIGYSYNSTFAVDCVIASGARQSWSYNLFAVMTNNLDDFYKE